MRDIEGVVSGMGNDETMGRGGNAEEAANGAV